MTPQTVSAPPEFFIDTEAGAFVARYSERGLMALRFPDASAKEGRSLPRGADGKGAHWHELTSTAVRAILSGRAPKQLPPLDVSVGTEFQRRVWAALQRIPLGETRTYAALAAEVGNPKAVRAVGGACGANPIPVLIPCHRVLAAHGRIGGFSAGLPWKEWLLEREGVVLVAVFRPS
jgi:AraC family transcriptional regulator of adaptative response/methylated-DNA-[protein]-cysteine methyltransferase